MHDHRAWNRSERPFLLLRPLCCEKGRGRSSRPRLVPSPFTQANPGNHGARMSKTAEKRPSRPPQTQKERPGREHKMQPRPKVKLPEYKGSDKLKGKVALITGGDS